MDHPEFLRTLCNFYETIVLDLLILGFILAKINMIDLHMQMLLNKNRQYIYSYYHFVILFKGTLSQDFYLVLPSLLDVAQKNFVIRKLFMELFNSENSWKKRLYKIFTQPCLHICFWNNQRFFILVFTIFLMSLLGPHRIVIGANWKMFWSEYNSRQSITIFNISTKSYLFYFSEQIN